MNTIDIKFKELKKVGGKALIPFITAGDPNLEITKALILEMEKQGADIIELGIPFSDPLADGPTIQKASQRALKNQTSLKDVLKLVKEIRGISSIPLIFMTYYNVIFKYGVEKFVQKAISAGVDGIIIPDLPPEEAKDLTDEAHKKYLDTIFLLTPTSTKSRINLIAKKSQGFIYYVSLTGVTGARNKLASDIEQTLKLIRSQTKKPIAVGFGISTPEQAAKVASWADGIIVGSAIVKIIEENIENPDLVQKVGEFVKHLKKAINPLL